MGATYESSLVKIQPCVFTLLEADDTLFRICADYSIHISVGHVNSEWIGDGISGKHFNEVSLYSMHSKHGANTTIQS